MDRSDYFGTCIGRHHLDRMSAALWVFDIDEARILWANAAALRFWEASSIEDLSRRNLGADMSPVVRRRLRQYQEDFTRGPAEFRESWTIYPRSVPRTLDVIFRGIPLPDGRMAMLCEAPELVRSTPEALRSAEAVLHTSVCISLLDFDGSILYANTAARACYGGQVTSALGRYVDAADFLRMLEIVKLDGVMSESVEVETLFGRRWHHIQASRCFDSVTGEKAVLVSENDVTEAHEARQVLLSSRNAAIEANRLKTEFVANMSHEIRTPLNGVIGVAQLLARTDLDPQQRELLATIGTSGSALLAIIQDILDISRIEAGFFDLEEGRFEVSRLLHDVAETIFGTAVGRGVRVRIDSQLEGDDHFAGDAKRIKQVLINLVGNAVKFSAQTDVTLSARAHSQTQLEFSVTDRGPGISKADQRVIFDRFRQADGSMRRQYGGAGLGLSISKSLVEIMGGTIGVASTIGQGATFWVRLPLERVAAQSPQQPEQDLSEGVGLLGLRVLLADDNATNQFIIKRLCELSGMEITLASNGRDAVELLGQRSFDIVLMDLHMPILSGIEAIAAIRASDAIYRTVPIIVLSADAMEMSMRRVIDLGADDYLTKPIDAGTLLTRISQLASRDLTPKNAATPRACDDASRAIAAGPSSNETGSD